MNKLTVACAILVLISFATVRGYDFKDYAFNKFLSDDVQDYFLSGGGSFSHRSKREVDDGFAENCRKFSRFMCCAKDEIHGLMTKNREAKKACFDEFMGDFRGPPPDAFQCENVMELKKRAMCVGQCYAQKLGIIDSQGDVNKNGLKDFLTENLKMDWFEPLIEEVAEKCSAEANGEQDEEAMCKPNGMKLMHCIFTEVQLRCPDNEIEDKEMCSKLRNFIIPHMKTD